MNNESTFQTLIQPYLSKMEDVPEVFLMPLNVSLTRYIRFKLKNKDDIFLFDSLTLLLVSSSDSFVKNRMGTWFVGSFPTDDWFQRQDERRHREQKAEKMPEDHKLCMEVFIELVRNLVEKETIRIF